MSTSTEDYIAKLESLKSGDLGLLRTHAGHGIDHSSQAFDLFSGLWWPLREKSQRAPRREVAWLVAKLYAYRPMQQADTTLAQKMATSQPRTSLTAMKSFRQRFDQLLMSPLSTIEEPLRWALDKLPVNSTLNWVKLTDDLSIWERESTRLKWAQEFLTGTKKEE